MAFAFDQASLAGVALEKGFLTTDQVRECLKLEEGGRGKGRSENFVDLLLRKKYLTEQQLTACKRALAGRDKVGGFELLEMVGQGSMGAVFRAKQTSLERDVALKILPKKFAEDDKYVKRFLVEARTVAKLNHQNIIQGIDVGLDGEHMYFAMEFVDGPTVRQMIRDRGEIPESEALGIATQIARALGHAHSHKLVHRDVKPDNIMVTSEGIAKLCDLGLARRYELVEAGAAVGTPFYIAPEQARGKGKVDIRADIYGLGATLFHMLSGRPPYLGDSAGKVMDQHINSPVPDVRRHNSEVSLKTSGLVRSMMAKDPAKRPQTPAALIAEIEKILDPKARPKPASSTSLHRATRSRPQGGTGGMAVIAIVAAVGLVAVALLLSSPGSKRPEQRERKPDAVPEHHVRAEEMLQTAIDLVGEHPDDHGRNVKLLERMLEGVENTPSEGAARRRLRTERDRLAGADRKLVDDALAKARGLTREGKFSAALEALLSLPGRLRQGRLEEYRKKALADNEEKAAEAVAEAAAKRGSSGAVKALEALRANATRSSERLIDAELDRLRRAEADTKGREEAERRRKAAAAAKLRARAHEGLLKQVNVLVRAGKLDEAGTFLAGAPRKKEYRGLAEAVAGEKSDLESLKALHSTALDEFAGKAGLIKFSWKGRSVTGSVLRREGDVVLLRTRRGAQIRVTAPDLDAYELVRLAGVARGAKQKTSRAAALCGMGMLREAVSLLKGAPGPDAERLRKKVSILTGGREAAARDALSAAAKLVAAGKKAEALKALDGIERDYGSTDYVKSAAKRIDELRNTARSAVASKLPGVKVEHDDTEAGKRAASGDWRGLSTGKVRSLRDGRVTVSYDLSDPGQLSDWRIVSGGWVYSAGGFESTGDGDSVVACWVPFLRVDSIDFQAVSHTASPGALGWTAYNGFERYVGKAVWGWMRQAGNTHKGGTSLELGGEVLASKSRPAPHRMLCKMSVLFGKEDGSVKWRLAGVEILSSKLDRRPGGKQIGIGSAAAPGRFDNVVVTGVPDYKTIAKGIEGALRRAKIGAVSVRMPWRSLVDDRSVPAWQVRSGQWNVGRGYVEKVAPAFRGGRAAGGAAYWSPSQIDSGVKATDFILEASVKVDGRGGPQSTYAAAFTFGSGKYLVMKDVSANLWTIRTAQGGSEPEFIPTSEKLEPGDEHKMRLTVIGGRLRLEVAGRVKLVARLTKPSTGSVGCYAQAPNSVRFTDVRIKVLKE